MRNLQCVWSEEEHCVSILSADLDNLISPQHSLEQVLERTATCLGRRESRGGGGEIGGSSHVGEEEGDSCSDIDDDDDDDDDDSDAYYGEDIDVAAMDVGPSQASR